MTDVAVVTAPGRCTDVGRLFVLPVMACLGIASLVATWQHIVEPDSSGSIQVALVVRSLMLVGFYALVVRFYLLRMAARSTTSSWPARVAAVVATFLPFTLSLVAAEPSGSLLVLTVADGLMLGGLAWSVWALLHLGKSLSLVAQARDLVRTGPYRVVRHPLYLGELATALGFVVGGFSWAAVGVLALLAALQLYRAAREEEVLAGAFPEYAGYRVDTPARVIPGLY